MATDDLAGFGRIAFEYEGKRYPLEVLQSHRGFYIGTTDEEGDPLSRESLEYFRREAEAGQAMEQGHWTQNPL